MRPRGATVNDASARSRRRRLSRGHDGGRGVDSGDGSRSPVPVALERHGAARNQVGVMLVRLPLIVGDPDERLRMIVEQSRVEKMTARDQGTLEFMRGPVGARIMTRLAARQRLVGGFVTDVHGPDRPQKLAGAPIERIRPVAVLAANVRLGVGALSVGGRLGLGIHSDAAHVPGAPFADALRKELARLTRVTRGHPRVSVARMTDHRTDQPAQADESPTGGDQTTEDQLEADNRSRRTCSSPLTRTHRRPESRNRT